ncbi:unnamed protein product [Rotaria socialis]|uniref:RING-type domain-containing protein n=1 Tax=Rotaria socialis TaxID=392032 RepID=A0A821JC35_9BILA|nr:unnamed protein product [Rotaria socialis]CAF3567170.1 unnamed protein product [Rotaria socialis]CAF4322035.1 unnamed protein product [Rotaria socialis]CAF4716221.1 unnamed protein product [Rotaria socialis]
MSSFDSYQKDGNDFESITRIMDASSLLRCPLCKNDIQDPRILCSNGHTFCHNCITNALPADGVLKCPVCNEARRLSSIQEVGQLTKNHTLLTLKKAEHHRLAQLGICELCNKKTAYGRCYHCRSLACFSCMDEHEKTLANEQAKEYADLVKIRENLTEKLSQWDNKLDQSKENIRELIHKDAEKHIKEIQEREQTLYNQLDDLHQNYLLTKNTKLQKLSSDIEKDSKELDKIDPKNWTISDRQHLTQHWLDLQQKFDDQSINFIYKSNASSTNHTMLGELHLKTANQDNEHLQMHRLQRQQLLLIDPFDNHDGIYRSNQIVSGRESKALTRKRLIMKEQNSTGHPNAFLTQSIPSYHENDPEGGYRGTGFSVKFNTKTDGSISRNRSRLDDQHLEQEGNEYTTRKVLRSHQPPNLSLSSGFEQQSQIEDNTILTPRMPVSPVQLNDYSKKAIQVLAGPNETDKFLAPKAIVVTDSNHLLIADTKKHRIIVYDLNLGTMRGLKGFLFPDGLCLAGEQFVIITDRHRVSKYDWLHGKMINFVGSKKEGCTRTSFSWPKGVAIDSNYIYVCDSYNSRMVVFNHQMKYENEWIIMRGSKKLDPQYISISNNLLYVTAWQRVKPESCAYNAGCIIVYGLDGNAQRFIDTDAQSYLNLSVPEGIICDSSNQLILADRYTSKIFAMSDGNQQVIHFRGDRMKAPHYVCFTNDQNTMIVSDVGNNTVQFYEKNK